MTADEIIKQIKESGFLTETQIKLRVGNKENISKIFSKIKEDDHIHEVKYTNSFVAKYTIRKMFVFNPNKKRRKRKAK